MFMSSFFPCCSFWSRSLKTLSASCARRFIAAFCEYSEAIVQQAYDRSQEHIRDIESYLVLRRYTIGAKLGFALLDCQDAVLNHPRIGDLETAAIDLISLSNVSAGNGSFFRWPLT